MPLALVTCRTSRVEASMRNLRSLRILHFVLMMLIVSGGPVKLLSQEVRSEEKLDSEKSPEDLQREKDVMDVLLGNKRFLPSDLISRDINRSNLKLQGTPPTTFVNFGAEPTKPSKSSFESDNNIFDSKRDPKFPSPRQRNLYAQEDPTSKKWLTNFKLFDFTQKLVPSRREIVFSNNYYYYQPLRAYDLWGSKEFYYDDDLFVLGGHVTTADERWFMERNLNYVLGSKFSPKLDRNQQIHAAALTAKRFSTGEVVVFDGLPHETDASKSRAELRRMGLHWDVKSWQKARPEISRTEGAFATKNATKKAVEEELQTGSNNVLFLIAHSDSESIFFPGLHGGSLSIQELDQIRRKNAPNRVIVLLMCGTGQVNGKLASIAETIVKNKLAVAVMATGGIVDAAKLSEMLRNFQEHGLLRKAFPDLRGIVQLETPLVAPRETPDS